MSIPKIIHYCWFGETDLPVSVEKYINNWREKCPDYEIIQWNESNFDVSSCRYAKEAYKMKKWAFVSDYARFCAVYKMGGIYLDTDIEVLKKFDDLLNCGAFFGFGRAELTVPIFGAEKGHPCLEDIIAEYEKRVFIMEDLSIDTTAIEKTVEKVLVNRYELKMNGLTQKLANNINVYSKDYFFSRDYRTGIIEVNPNLYVIHYGDGTWLDESEKALLESQHNAVKKFGPKFGLIIGKILFYLKSEGFIRFSGRIIRSIKTRIKGVK